MFTEICFVCSGTAVAVNAADAASETLQDLVTRNACTCVSGVKMFSIGDRTATNASGASYDSGGMESGACKQESEHPIIPEERSISSSIAFS